eukprot:s57_g10.t1
MLGPTVDFDKLANHINPGSIHVHSVFHGEMLKGSQPVDFPRGPPMPVHNSQSGDLGVPLRKKLVPTIGFDHQQISSRQSTHPPCDDLIFEESENLLNSLVSSQYFQSGFTSCPGVAVVDPVGQPVREQAFRIDWRWFLVNAMIQADLERVFTGREMVEKIGGWPRAATKHGYAMSQEDRNADADVRPQTLAEPGQTEAGDEADDTALPRPQQPEKMSLARSLRRQPTSLLIGKKFWCLFLWCWQCSKTDSRSWVQFVSSPSEFRAVAAEPTPPTPTPPSEHVGENLDDHLEPTTSATRGSESISVTSTCSPSPAMDSHDTEADAMSHGSHRSKATTSGHDMGQ